MIMKHNIIAEAKAVLNMKSPLKTFTKADIGTFVMAYSDLNTCTAVPGTLMGYGVDEQGEYAMVKPFTGGDSIRYEHVVPMPTECLPTEKTETETVLWRDPYVEVPV